MTVEADILSSLIVFYNWFRKRATAKADFLGSCRKCILSLISYVSCWRSTEIFFISAVRGPRWPRGAPAREPGGPRPTGHDGPAARWPSPNFPQFFCPAVSPRACIELHLVWMCKIEYGEFEFGYDFNNHLNPFWSSLSLLVVKWKNVVILCLFVCWQNPIERKCIVKRFKWLNGKRIETHRLPCCTPKPDADLCMCVDSPLDKKLWEIRTGPRAAGQLGRLEPWAKPHLLPPRSFPLVRGLIWLHSRKESSMPSAIFWVIWRVPTYKNFALAGLLNTPLLAV